MNTWGKKEILRLSHEGIRLRYGAIVMWLKYQPTIEKFGIYICNLQCKYINFLGFQIESFYICTQYTKIYVKPVYFLQHMKEQLYNSTPNGGPGQSILHWISSTNWLLQDLNINLFGINWMHFCIRRGDKSLHKHSRFRKNLIFEWQRSKWHKRPSREWFYRKIPTLYMSTDMKVYSIDVVNGDV